MKMSVRKLIVALLIGVTASVSANAAAMQATVLSAKGKTEVQKGASWAPLKVGSILQKGDVIQTGFKSELILKIKNTTVTVAPLSRITIEQLASKGSKDDTRLFLDTGSLKSEVKKTEDRRVGFTVRSPVATASVRGTILGVSNGFGGSTTVRGYEGVTASWKNSSPATPEVAADEGPETAANNGNDADAISDGQSEAGATLNRAGQVTSFTQSGTVTPQGNAKIASVSIGSVPSVAEAVSDPVTASTTTSTPAKADKKANVIVTVTYSPAD